MLTNETERGVTRKAGKKFSAQDQCRAVLLVWSERQSQGDVCRELKTSSSLLGYWQEKAMEGLIAALTPREGREVAQKGPRLSLKVKRLMERKAAEREGVERAQARLAGMVKRLPPAPAPTREG